MQRKRVRLTGATLLIATLIMLGGIATCQGRTRPTRAIRETGRASSFWSAVLASVVAAGIVALIVLLVGWLKQHGAPGLLFYARRRSDASDRLSNFTSAKRRSRVPDRNCPAWSSFLAGA